MNQNAARRASIAKAMMTTDQAHECPNCGKHTMEKKTDASGMKCTHCGHEKQ